MGPCRRAGCGVLAIVLGIGVTSCGDDGGLAGKSIRYQVDYTNSPAARLNHRAVSIVYSTNEGQQEQKFVPLPWTKVIGTANPGFKASVKAQFYGFGTISCRIVADGEVLQTQVSAEAPYAVVECSG